MSEENAAETEGGLVIQELRINHPTAVKAGTLSGQKADQLADLVVHRADLVFAKQCVDELYVRTDQSVVIRNALLRSAIVAWSKCFNTSKAKRFRLKVSDIYPDGLARKTAYHFAALRDKHIAHDDNPYSQAMPIVWIGPRGGGRKVLEVAGLGMTANMSTSGESLDNLARLIRDALSWVDAQRSKVIAALERELEATDYEKLLALPEPKLAPPNQSDVAVTRTR